MEKAKHTILFLILVSLCSSVLVSQETPLTVKADESFEPWNFIALGDSRNWDENLTNTVRKTVFEDVMQSNPNLDFILHTGDMVNNGGEQDDWNRYYEDIDLLVQNNVTFYYGVGNHEMYTYKLPDGSYGPYETDFATYMANVEMLGNERYYSFDHKGIHFLFINTDEYWAGDDFEITTVQEAWLINDLQSNTMNFTIAAFHRPMYSVRSGSRVTDAAGIRSILKPIFLEYGVDLAFSGHDHYYYRTQREGIHHIVTGGAGAPLYTPTETQHAIDGDEYFAEYHYCNVSVTEEEVKIDVLVYDSELEYTTIQDSITIDLIEPTTTKTSFSVGLIFLIGWIIPILRRKRK